ncbi:hypothetical protein BST61_g9789 [Cercospora zeina]
MQVSVGDRLVWTRLAEDCNTSGLHVRCPDQQPPKHGRNPSGDLEHPEARAWRSHDATRRMPLAADDMCAAMARGSVKGIVQRKGREREKQALSWTGLRRPGESAPPPLRSHLLSSPLLRLPDRHDTGAATRAHPPSHPPPRWTSTRSRRAVC